MICRMVTWTAVIEKPLLKSMFRVPLEQLKLSKAFHVLSTVTGFFACVGLAFMLCPFNDMVTRMLLMTAFLHVGSHLCSHKEGVYMCDHQ